jgi:transposase
MLLEGLGINDGLAGKEALAELLVYADFVDSSLRVLERLLGLYKPIRSSGREYWRRIYNGRLHRAVTRLAMAYYKNRPSGRQCWELVKKIKQLVVTFSGTRIGPPQRVGNPRTIHTGG